MLSSDLPRKRKVPMRYKVGMLNLTSMTYTKVSIGRSTLRLSTFLLLALSARFQDLFRQRETKWELLNLTSMTHPKISIGRSTLRLSTFLLLALPIDLIRQVSRSILARTNSYSKHVKEKIVKQSSLLYVTFIEKSSAGRVLSYN